MGVWNKRVVCTEEQEVIVQPNEAMDGVVLLCREVAENGGFADTVIGQHHFRQV